MLSSSDGFICQNRGDKNKLQRGTEMIRKNWLSMFALLVLFPACLYAGTTSGTLIQTLGLDNGAPDVLFISVDHTKSSPPGCQTNGSWAYVLPLAGDQNKKLYAMLLAARASQMPVTLVGAGVCDAFSGIETLQVTYY